MNFLSVCSGIEAASVAFMPLGWKAVAFAEIEPFPCALLKHHYPKVPNLGDLTKYLQWCHKLLAEVDILVGGTPCQAFSVAGLRQSLTDNRGNLTLTFCLLYAHICKIRHAAGRPAPLLLWENVPGVLNTADNAFGCFLAGLAGENGALRPPGGKWLNAGYVRGPIGSIAWRTLDAQYFGLAQRRERVFALGSVDPAFNPAEVLFEFDGLRRDSAPCREPGKDTTAGTLRSTDGGVEVGHAQANHLIADAAGVCPPLTTSPHADNLSEEGKLIPEVAWAIQARDSKGSDSKGSDSNTKRGHLIPEVCPTLLGGGNSTGGHRPPRSTVDNCESLIPEQMAFKASHFTRGKDGDKGDQDTLVLAFDTTQITSPTNRSQPKVGAPCHPLAAGAHPPAIAFSSKDHGADATSELSPTLRAGNHDKSHANGGSPPAVAYVAFSGRTRGDDGRGYDRPPLVFGGEVVGAIETVKPHCIAFPEKLSGTQCASTADVSPVLQSHNPTAVAFQPRIAHNGRGDMGELVNALQAQSGQSGQSGKGDAAPCVAVQEAVGFKPRHYRLPNKDGAADAISGPLTANMEHSGDCSPHAAYSDGIAWRVRRLSPEECEILQGFPLGYSLIPGYSNKLRKGADLAQTIEYLRSVMPMVDEEQLAALAHSPDGPRYKALGNSWAVPCVRWIGSRIDCPHEICAPPFLHSNPMKTNATTAPDFQPLRPAGASENGAIFGFTVWAGGAKKTSKVRFSISAGAKPEGWLDTHPTYLRLDVCGKTNLGRLILVGMGSEQARKLEVNATTKRGEFFFPYTGKVKNLFPEYAGVCELDIVETTGDAITFKLPEIEEPAK